MTVQSSSRTRWAAALALTVAAALAFDTMALGSLGVLALPLAVYAAGSATGWARNDAVAIAAASGLVAFFGMLTFGRFTSFSLVAFDIVTLVALRPQRRRNLGYRIGILLVWFLVAIDVRAWWTVLLVPLLVVAADELTKLTAPGMPELSPGAGPTGRLEPAFAGPGQIGRAPSAEGDASARWGASAALALASVACLLLVGFEFFATTGSTAPVVLTVAFAIGGVVLAVRALRTEPMRATAALVLAAIPLAFIGFLVLIVLSGGFQIMP